MKHLYEAAGWYGAIAILLAYFLNSYSVINSASLVYQVLNFTGAIGIVALSFYKKAFQPVFLNIVWAIIALVAIVRLSIA